MLSWFAGSGGEIGEDRGKIAHLHPLNVVDRVDDHIANRSEANGAARSLNLSMTVPQFIGRVRKPS